MSDLDAFDPSQSGTSSLHLRIFDGSRQLFAAPAQFLITITDGMQNQLIRAFYTANDLTFDDLPFYDNFGDDYTVLAWAEGFRQAGYTPVQLSNTFTRTLDLMLVRDDPGFSFVDARFSAASTAYPFLAANPSGAPGTAQEPATAEANYDTLLDQQPKFLACALNLAEAMSQIHLSQGTPLDYLKQIRWDGDFAPRQDRFFAWCDNALIHQVMIAADAGLFAEELNPGLLHAGATRSWKQIQFGEANVQLTFHEALTATIDGVECTIVEPDIDYFRDLAAHVLLEVVPNALTQTLTEPAEVYVLRWIAGQTAGIPEFSPLYTLT